MEDTYSIKYSICLKMNKEETEMVREQVKNLKRKYGIPRSEVLRLILTKFLADDGIIKILKAKGGLRTKMIKLRKPKKFG